MLTAEELTAHALPGGFRQRSGRPYRTRGGVVQHECVEYFEDLGQLAGREIFTVIRNPCDRVLSEIFYLLRTIPAAQHVFCGPTWADDLKTYASNEGYLAHDLKACPVDWLLDSKGDLRCDRILRFETLATDWNKLCHDWELGNVPLPHAHDTGRRIPCWEFYDEAAAQAIAQKYARDFDLLGYDTALPVTSPETVNQRFLWLGDGPAPDPEMLVANPDRPHGRLEIPQSPLGAVRIHGKLEMLSHEAGAALLRQCHQFLAPGGTLICDTLDLAFLASLVGDGYDEDSAQGQFVRNYVDQFLPVGSKLAPAMVLTKSRPRCIPFGPGHLRRQELVAQPSRPSLVGVS